MYIVAICLVNDSDYDFIDIGYQQGLKDLVSTSDFPEGLLNHVDRPSIKDHTRTYNLFQDEAIPHFNEIEVGQFEVYRNP
jgi:hypothetical protein